MDSKIVAWSTMSAPDTKKSEEETGPKLPSILPEKIDMGIWAIQGKCFEVMKSSGYDATTDFCKFSPDKALLPLPSCFSLISNQSS
jgi:hypothetical protein